MLRGTPEQVRNACRDAIEQSKPGSRFILSGGCEIPRDTPAENLRAMLAAAREFGRYDNSN
jgi:uroporphyrinogen-III decarboxylase